MLGLYNLLYLLAFAAWSPWVVWRVVSRRDYREGVAERVGLPARRASRAPLAWVHGVSVGEIKASIPLVKALAARRPGLEILLSSTTPTGHGLARRSFPDQRVLYYPLDFWRFPTWSLDRLRPDLILLVELELWPNFLEAARRRGTPVAVVNGRISERSFARYSLVRGLLPQHRAISLFCMQNEEYAERVRRLGVPAERVRVTGNMKYDVLPVREPGLPDPEFAALLAGPGRLVLAAGSTHPGEEETLQRIAGELRRRTGRSIPLVLAPRHPERAPALAGALAQLGARVVRLTEARAGGVRAPLAPETTLLVDTIGDLERAYSVADLVFVGGSLAQRGGQNMLEPAAMARPVFFGPHTWNFRADVELLLAARAAVQVPGEAELLAELERFVETPALARELGAKAREFILAHKGATERTLAELQEAGLLQTGPDSPPAA